MAEPNKTLLKLNELEQKVNELALKSAGGGGTFDGMEPRVAKLEAAVEHIEEDVGDIKTDIRGLRGDISTIRTLDFRILFGAIITATLGLALIMAKGFHWL